MHSKYSIFWFAILLATVCISCLNVSKSFAISYDEFKDFLNENKNEVINSDKLNAINYFINNDIELIEQSWFDVNTIIMGVPTISTSPTGIDSWEFYFFDTDNDAKMYINKTGNINYLNFGETVDFIQISFFYRHNGGTWSINRQDTGTTSSLTATTLLGKKNQYIVSNKNIYTSLVSDSIADYIFITPFQAGPQFIPRNNIDIVFYEQTWWKLGYIDGAFEKSKCKFYFYDVTDPDNLYPPMIASLGNGLRLEDDGDLQIETRLIQSYHTYDIYFLYERR